MTHKIKTASLSRRKLLRLGAVLPAIGLASAGLAHSWPNAPVNVLVGFPGGSSPDLTARLLAEGLHEVLGQPVVVENRTGAGGNIAAAALARAGDHTISVMINGNLTVARLLNPKLSFDPLTDFAPIALVGTAPYVLVAGKTLADGLDAGEFLDRAREAGDTWNYGSPGLGTVAHIGMELVKSRTGIAAMHVPYQGNPQALQAVLSGEIQMSLLPPAMALAQHQAGRLSMIGITSARRSVLTGDLPSLQELGVPGLDLEVWNAVAAPASMPVANQEKLRNAIAQVVQSAGTRQKLLEQGWVVNTDPEGLQARIQADTQTLGSIIREQNIRIDA